MPVTELNHFLIRANDLERTKDFYCKVLGHIAFLATDPEKFVKHLKAVGVPCRPRNFPESQLYQLFIKVPDAPTTELNFFGVTKAPDWGGEDYSKMPRASSKDAS